MSFSLINYFYSFKGLDPSQYVFLFANIKLIPLGGDGFCGLEVLTTFKANIALNKLKQFELFRLFLL